MCQRPPPDRSEKFNIEFLLRRHYRPRAEPIRFFTAASCRFSFGEPDRSAPLTLPLPVTLATALTASCLASREERRGCMPLHHGMAD